MNIFDAICTGKIENLKICLSDLNNINIRYSGKEADCLKKDDTPLLYAAKKKNIEMIKILLSVPGIDINTSHNGEFILSILSKNNSSSVEVIKLLVDAGTKINTPNPINNCTPFMSAVLHKNCEAAKYFLEKGADINQFFLKETAIVHATRQEDINMIHLLLKQPGISFIGKAIKAAIYGGVLTEGTNAYKIAMLLANSGLDINHVDVNDASIALGSGQNILHKICIAGGAQCHILAEICCRKGIDVNLRDNGGDTPLDVACGRFNHEFVKTLLANGANSLLMKPHNLRDSSFNNARLEYEKEAKSSSLRL